MNATPFNVYSNSFEVEKRQKLGRNAVSFVVMRFYRLMAIVSIVTYPRTHTVIHKYPKDKYVEQQQQQQRKK